MVALSPGLIGVLAHEPFELYLVHLLLLLCRFGAIRTSSHAGTSPRLPWAGDFHSGAGCVLAVGLELAGDQLAADIGGREIAVGRLTRPGRMSASVPGDIRPASPWAIFRAWRQAGGLMFSQVGRPLLPPPYERRM